MKKILPLIIFTLILLSSVNADVSVNFEPSVKYIWQDESAVFDSVLQNKLETNDRISFVSQDYNWDTKKESFELSSKEVKRFQLVLTPNDKIVPGKYAVPIRFYSETTKRDFNDFTIIIDVLEKGKVLDYDFEINPNGLDPKKDNLVKLDIINTKDLDIGEVDVRIFGELFEKSFTLNIDPSGTTQREFDIKIDKEVEEGIYEVNLVVSNNKRIFVDEKVLMQVGAYSDFIERKEVTESFLKTEINLIEENRGNNRISKAISYNAEGIKKYFTKVTPEPNKEENGVYEWELDLQSKEIKNIKIIIDYRTPLMILIGLIFILYGVYKAFRKDLSIRKKVLTIKSAHGIAELKVMIVIKNKGKLTKEVKIIDYLPKIIKAPDQYSTIKPNSIKKTQKGLMLEWKINELLRREERVISYSIKSSKVKVIGKMNMPRTLCSYKLGRKRKIVSSNSVMING